MYRRLSRSSIVRLASSSSVRSILNGRGSNNLENNSARYCHKNPGSSASKSELKFFLISSNLLVLSATERLDSVLKRLSQKAPKEKAESISSHCWNRKCWGGTWISLPFEGLSRVQDPACKHILRTSATSRLWWVIQVRACPGNNAETDKDGPLWTRFVPSFCLFDCYQRSMTDV